MTRGRRPPLRDTLLGRDLCAAYEVSRYANLDIDSSTNSFDDRQQSER